MEYYESSDRTQTPIYRFRFTLDDDPHLVHVSPSWNVVPIKEMRQWLKDQNVPWHRYREVVFIVEFYDEKQAFEFKMRFM